MNDVKKYTPRQSSNLRNVERISSSPTNAASGGPVQENRSAGVEGHLAEYQSPQRDRARAEDPSAGGEDTRPSIRLHRETELASRTQARP